MNGSGTLDLPPSFTSTKVQQAIDRLVVTGKRDMGWRDSCLAQAMIEAQRPPDVAEADGSHRAFIRFHRIHQTPHQRLCGIDTRFVNAM